MASMALLEKYYFPVKKYFTVLAKDKPADLNNIVFSILVTILFMVFSK